MNTPERVRYILYARKSSESEDKQMASLNDQIEVMKKLAEDRGLHIHDVIQEARSAKEPGRPGFQELLTRIQNGEADGILTWKLNRLARNPVDGGQISWLLQRGVIRHIQTFEGVYKPTDNVILMQVEFGMANQYVNNLRTDVKRGLLSKAKRGWFPSPRLPYGYMYNRDYKEGVNDKIIPHPKHFSIMKSLWDKLLTGNYTVPMILKEANAMGLVNQVNRPFSRSTLYKYFSHPFYYGEFTWRNENGEPEVFVGKHKPMISKADFFLVQNILGARANPNPTISYNHTYCEVFHCGECGCSITAEQKVQAICSVCKKKFSIKNTSNCTQCGTHLERMDSPKILTYTYYRCTKKRGHCSQRYISEQELEKQIFDELSKIALPPAIVELLKQAISKADNLALTNDSIWSAEKYRQQISKLKERKSRLIDLYTDGGISREEYLEKASDISTQIEALERLVNTTEEAFRLWKKEAHAMLDIAKNALEIFNNDKVEEKRTLVKGLGSNLTIIDKKLEFTTYFLLLAFRSMVEGVLPDWPWLEPEKMAQQSPYQGEIRLTEVQRLRLLADVDSARTYWLEKEALKTQISITIPQSKRGDYYQLPAP